jgi:hypothetical protein
LKLTLKTAFGCVLVIIGLLVIAFSKQIVFPGLERVVVVETIVGKNNVVYESDGSYGFTNPRAMLEWVSSVALVGILIGACGIWISGIRIKFPARKHREISN